MPTSAEAACWWILALPTWYAVLEIDSARWIKNHCLFAAKGVKSHLLFFIHGIGSVKITETCSENEAFKSVQNLMAKNKPCKRGKEYTVTHV